MSVQAIVWVLEEAPDLPKHLVGTLVGLANHADQNGRGAYPSQDLVGWYARKDERSVRRDLEQLEEIGLIAPGDQRMVLHLPANRRPVVYDLAMQKKRGLRPDPRAAGRPRMERPEIGGTPTSAQDVDPGNRGDAHVQIGGTPTSNWGDAHVRQSVLEPSLEPSSSSGSNVNAYLIAATGADDDEAELLIKKIKGLASGPIRGFSAYARSIPVEDLREHLAEIRAAARPHLPAARPPQTAAWRTELAARQAAGASESATRSRRGAALARAALARAAQPEDAAS